MDVNNFLFHCVGIGDITIYSTELLKNSTKRINIQFDKAVLKTYKSENLSEYFEFIKKYTQKILFNKELTFNDAEHPKQLEISYHSFVNSVTDPYMIEHFYDVFSSKVCVIDEPYVVINTKVRNFRKKSYESIKDKFLRNLNSINEKIVLLGEREIEYGAEYSVHGNTLIYSIYDDLKKKFKSRQGVRYDNTKVRYYDSQP